VFLRPLYRRPVTDKVTAESIIFITWAFYITIKVISHLEIMPPNRLFLYPAS